MSAIYDCRDAKQALTGLRMARGAIGRGELVVLPTDTVYGIAANAFDRDAVSALLAAKGRGRQAPPPVLVAGLETLHALAESVSPEATALAEAFWPGGLTLIVPVNPMLDWDLGETHGTVAVRMPAHDLALELLAETGPLAVSSANKTGKPAALTAAEARDYLGDSVTVYLDAGESSDARTGSTIVDVTPTLDGKPARIVRQGTIAREAIASVCAVEEADA